MLKFQNMKMIKFVTLALLLILVYSCGTNPYSKTNKVYREQAKVYAKELKELPPNENTTDTLYINYAQEPVGTVNFNLRRPNYVVIHHTAQDSVQQTLKSFTLPRTQVSAHYVIAKDGTVYHMLNDYYRAWHAGAGQWGGNKDLNSSSIGIELDNNGFEEFSPLQINSLMKLLKKLKAEYKIPDENFIGHSDLAPSRKVDPNINFPWKLLAEEGYGLWYDEDQIEEMQIEQDSVTLDLAKELIVPKNFDPIMALRIIGYDVSKPDSAIKAFELHFIQNEPDGKLTDRELKILYNLYKKYI